MMKMLQGDGLGGQGLHYVPEVHRNTVIFLHGLGDTAYGWVNFIDALSRQRSEVFLQTKYILPTAPTRPITMNGGIPMPAWADIYGLHKEAPEDQEGYASSIQRIIQLIKNEIKQGVPPQKILLGGFSQGAALSYLVLEVVKVPLGGVLFLSGWLPFTSIRRERYKDFNEALLRIPILHCHGTDDSIVSHENGAMSIDVLKNRGFTHVTWRAYSGAGHSVCDQEIKDAIAFIQSVFEATPNNITASNNN